MTTSEQHYRRHAPDYKIGGTRKHRILEMIGRSRGRVLDVGCGTGQLGRALKDRGHWVGGIELSDDAVMRAREHLDTVWQFNIEERWPDLGKPMDAIIFAEVLEHVFDPVKVIRQSERFLTPGGLVIITTPNMLHWLNRLVFLAGSFRYERSGMFDFGHIRWFTYAYLRNVLRDAGFEITHERHIIVPGTLSFILRTRPSLFARTFVVASERIDHA